MFNFKKLEKIINKRLIFNPKYSWSSKIFSDGLITIIKKIHEEFLEFLLSIKIENNLKIISESSDLMYHLILLIIYKNLKIDTILSYMKRKLLKKTKCFSLTILSKLISIKRNLKFSWILKLFSKNIDEILFNINNEFLKFINTILLTNKYKLIHSLCNFIYCIILIVTFRNISFLKINFELKNRTIESGISEKKNRDIIEV